MRLPFVVALFASLSFAPTASATPAFRDSVLSTSAARSLQATAEWGGATVASNGETVTIYFSDSYPVDTARAKQWADFMTSLVHGSELSTVAIHLAPLTEVVQVCGGGALACYNPRRATIYAPADDVDPTTSAKGILTHEYGHHVAASRTNPPFTSVDYGTKRWASYENVCARTRAGELYPGAEDAQNYALNPGEGFAESYRVLNEQKLGLPLEEWFLTTSLQPDATALSLLEQDVLTPWTANTTRKLTAKLNAKVRSRVSTVRVPYDGELSVSPRQTRSVKVSVSLAAKGGESKAQSFARATGSALSATVCGARTYTVRVKLTGKVTKTTRTTVSLTVSTP